MAKHYEKLYEAIRVQDVSTVEAMVKEVDLSDPEGIWPAADPPLVLAGKGGTNLALLRALSTQSCAVNARTATGETALHCVCAVWELCTLSEAVGLLLGAGGDAELPDNLRRQTPLHLLIKRFGNTKKVTGSPAKAAPELLAALRRLAEVSSVNARDHKSRTALHVLVASHCADPAPYKILLQQGASISIQNDRGETPVLEALECSAIFAAELLVQYSIFPCTRDDQIIIPPSPRTQDCPLKEDVLSSLETEQQIKAKNCGTVIIDDQIIPKIKTKKKSLPCCDTPLSAGVKKLSVSVCEEEWLMKATLYGETALHVAARKDNPSVVELLLKAAPGRPDLMGACDLNGDTALHLAAGRGHVEIVRMLVDTQGVDINAQNRRGLTPLHVAVESGFIHVVQILLGCPACDVVARTSDERCLSPMDLAQQEYRRRSQPEMSLLLLREAEKRKLVMS